MVKENKNIENKERVLVIDEQVAESYYLENESWESIGTAKGYGPTRAGPTVWPSLKKQLANRTLYSCAALGCNILVTSSGGYCSNHNRVCQESSCNSRVGSQYCSAHQGRCKTCNTEISYRQTYCLNHQVWQEQVIQNTFNSNGDYRKITIIYKRE